MYENKVKRRLVMSIVKVIEVISEGHTIDEALKAAVAEASKTVDGINQVNVQHIEAIVKNNKIEKVRINAKISFIVHEHKA